MSQNSRYFLRRQRLDHTESTANNKKKEFGTHTLKSHSRPLPTPLDIRPDDRVLDRARTEEQ